MQKFLIAVMEAGKDLLRLNAKVQNYAWGKRGRDSLVAELWSKGSDGSVKEDERYAEASKN